ncbi:hypothetical protein B0H19DRAFT_1367496 [Mycena capillaripes]|nr:hypothetical protein B0H19DRAFT_1367496 [Mycena capillaripes]
MLQRITIISILESSPGPGIGTILAEPLCPYNAPVITAHQGCGQPAMRRDQLVHSLHQSSSTLGKPESEPDGVKYTRRHVWPLCIILGQGLLLSLAWGFFATVRARGQIPLSLTVAELVQTNPQLKTYVVTFLATSLSALSSYLFSQAVRHAILVYLTRPLSVSTLGFGILISRRTPIFERRQIRWVLAGGIFSLATLGQTASWTVLLTPNKIFISTPLRGTEIDLTSDSFKSNDTQFNVLWNGTTGVNLKIFIESALASVIDTIGTASANSVAGYTSVLDFAGWEHVSSTRGIIPIDLVDSKNLGNPNIQGPVTYNTRPFPPPGTDFNVSMIQQGLTSDVSCQNQQLDVNTEPSVTRLANSMDILQGDQAVSYTAVSLSTVSMIIDGHGAYAGPNGESVVCTVTPHIEDYVVSYSGQYIYKNLNGEQPIHGPQVAPALPATAYIAIYGLELVFLYGQSGIRNVIGDSMAAIYNDEIPAASISPTKLWEAYITGVIEFTGTAVKTGLSANWGPLGGKPPLSMTRNISGYGLTTSLGWDYREAGSAAILIPSTFIAVASILIVLFAQFRNRGIPVQHADFDPNDPLLLMAAASAGGMREMFGGLAEGDVKEVSSKKVKLGCLSDDRDGFVEV